LTWDNPDEPFDHVRVLRSDTFFPTNPWDGELVYEGNAEMLTDTNILDTKRYYYTIFTKDDTGFSYGVSQSFQKGNDTTNNDTIGYPIGVFGPISDGSYIEALSESPFQIHVSQEGEDVKVVDDVYYIKAGSYILIQIPKTRKIPNDAQFFVVYVDKNNSAVQENYVLDFDSENQNYTTSFFPAQDGVSKNFIVYMKTRDGIVGYYGSILIDQNEQDRTTFFERILIEIFKILALIYAFFQKILSSILSLI